MEDDDLRTFCYSSVSPSPCTLRRLRSTNFYPVNRTSYDYTGPRTSQPDVSLRPSVNVNTCVYIHSTSEKRNEKLVERHELFNGYSYRSKRSTVNVFTRPKRSNGRPFFFFFFVNLSLRSRSIPERPTKSWVPFSN